MSIKMHELNREQVEKLVVEHSMRPAFIGQNPYIANGPIYEILVCLMPDGQYQAELLDKNQMEESLRQTIQNFQEYAESDKSQRHSPC